MTGWVQLGTPGHRLNVGVSVSRPELLPIALPAIACPVRWRRLGAVTHLPAGASANTGHLAVDRVRESVVGGQSLGDLSSFF